MIKHIELDQTINSNIKNNIKAILDANNLTLLEAINIFVNKINVDKALPFDIPKKPSDDFQKSINEINSKKVFNYTSNDPIKEMMEELKS